MKTQTCFIEEFQPLQVYKLIVALNVIFHSSIHCNVLLEIYDETSVVILWITINCFQLFSYCYLIVLNIWLLVNPSKLCFDYSMGCITPIESVFDRRFCLTISIVIVIIILLYRRIVNCLAWSRSAYQFNQFFFSVIQHLSMRAFSNNRRCENFCC